MEPAQEAPGHSSVVRAHTTSLLHITQVISKGYGGNGASGQQLPQLSFDLSTVADEDLERRRHEVYQQWQQNQRDYTTRYGDSPANYGSSISDDYNGDGQEFTRLHSLLQEIDAELDRRRQLLRVEGRE